MVLVDSGDMSQMADRIDEAVHTSWDSSRAVNYIKESHTWDTRAGVYHRLLQQLQ